MPSFFFFLPDFLIAFIDPVRLHPPSVNERRTQWCRKEKKGKGGHTGRKSDFFWQRYEVMSSIQSHPFWMDCICVSNIGTQSKFFLYIRMDFYEESPFATRWTFFCFRNRIPPVVAEFGPLFFIIYVQIHATEGKNTVVAHTGNSFFN